MLIELLQLLFIFRLIERELERISYAIERFNILDCQLLLVIRRFSMNLT